MPAINLIIPTKDSVEGYEEEIETHTDGLAAAGFYPQIGSVNNLLAGMERDTSGNLTFKDQVAGGPYTLTQLLASGGSGTTNVVSTFSISLNPPTSEIFGTVTGLAGAPVRVAGFSVMEQGVSVTTGLVYDVQVISLTADGFNYRLSIGRDEWWPGPGTMTLNVQYLWSAT
jgi:hypothetical protein